MKVLVRADASAQIGTGHVVRTRTLALALKERGAEVTFVCREHPGNMILTLRRDGFDVHALSAASVSVTVEDEYARWLGVSQGVDALQTLEVAGQGPWDWLIVDHYGLDARWETVLRPHVGRIMVIDDLANRGHDCDILLDQNYATAPEERYKSLVPQSCVCLLGPRYALLKPDYARVRASMPPHRDTIERVLVFFGGAARQELLEMTLEALTAPALRQLHVDLVLGAVTDIDVKPFAAKRPGSIEVYRGLPHLADLMARADIAIGAGGATTWERMCMGLPSVVVSIADNQTPACEALARDGLICYLGASESVTAEDVAGAVIGLARDADWYMRLAREGMAIVDGRGVELVAEALWARAV